LLCFRETKTYPVFLKAFPTLQIAKEFIAFTSENPRIIEGVSSKEEDEKLLDNNEYLLYELTQNTKLSELMSLFSEFPICWCKAQMAIIRQDEGDLLKVREIALQDAYLCL